MAIPSKLILPRYLVREHIGPFVFSTSIISLIFLLNLVFRELSRILSKGLPWNVVLEFFVLNMAWILALSVPMSVLTATLMAFGRLAADNEVTAMKANGISLYRMIAPVFVAAAVLAGLLVWFNNHILPDMNHRTRLLASDIARKRPSVNLEPGVWFDGLPNFGILVQNLEDSAHVTKVREILIDDHSNLDVVKTISAHRGRIHLEPSTGSMVILLFDGEMQEVNIRKPEEFHRLEFPRHLISIPVQDMFLQRSDSEYRGDREKSVTQLRSDVEAQRLEIRRLRNEINTLVGRELRATLDTTFGLGDKPSSAPSTDASQRHLPFEPPARGNIRTMPRATIPEGRSEAQPAAAPSGVTTLLSRQRLAAQNIDNLVNNVQSYRRGVSSLLVEIHKKFSIPFACLVFVLVGVPLGVITRRRGMAVSGGMSLGFFLVYWSFLIAGEDLADRQMLSPFAAMWMANLIVGTLGLYMMISVARERSAFNFVHLGRLVVSFVRRRSTTKP